MGDAKAERVQKIPAGISVRVGWPSNNLLRACGANILIDGLTRVVEIGGRKSCKGVMESTMRTWMMTLPKHVENAVRTRLRSYLNNKRLPKG